MNEPVPKFILVVTGNSVDDAFFDRLRQHTRTLKGTSLTHRVLPEQSDPGSPRPPEPPAPVIVEWFAAAPPNRADWARALQLDEERLEWYDVSEALRWQRPGVGHGPPTGISHICRVGRATGLTMEQFEQHWTQVHRPLAQKHHLGMALYVQNVVRRTLSTNGQGIDGIAELGFPSVEAFTTEMYDSEEGRAAISADVAKFVGAASCGLYQLVPG
jgi:uncharacterized protein (TIGR02118 family)